jgi:hypothetical protein
MFGLPIGFESFVESDRSLRLISVEGLREEKLLWQVGRRSKRAPCRWVFQF